MWDRFNPGELGDMQVVGVFFGLLASSLLQVLVLI